MFTFKQRCFVIAEAGVNHNGDINLAKRLIDVAADAGADAVKFQTFKAEKLVSFHAQKAAYQLQTTDCEESQFEMIRKLELTESAHETLIRHAKDCRIDFLSTPFDSTSLNLLIDRFELKTIKISSGEITNAPFLLEIARKAQKIILSTGMSSLAEVEAALGVLAFGFIKPTYEKPNRKSFEYAFASEEGQRALKAKVSLLHCITEYPAPRSEINLRAMDTMTAAFGLPIGYSDHTSGIHIALAAVARGAKIIEKHFTVDRKLPGPDHKASLEPNELKALVCQIRNVEDALGDGIKRPTPSEWKNRDIVRKSLLTNDKIKTGEIFTEKNLSCKRPGSGLSPFFYWNYFGQAAKRHYKVDEFVDD